jgi:hypothetical protein
MESASVHLNERQLIDAKNNLIAIVEFTPLHPIGPFAKILESITQWFSVAKSRPLPEKENGSTSKIWSGFDAAKILESFNITSYSLPNLISKFNDAQMLEDRERELTVSNKKKESLIFMTHNTRSVIERIKFV